MTSTAVRISCVVLTMSVEIAPAGLTAGGFSRDVKPSDTNVTPADVEVITPYVFDGNLSDVPVAIPWQLGDPIKEIPRRGRPRSIQPPPEPRTDPLLATQQGVESRTFTTPLLDFPGMGFTGVFPPDPVGDVGPNHYVQMINSVSGALVAVFDKSGAPIGGPFQLSSMGSGACSGGWGDPIVLHDHLADRWLLSEIGSSGNTLCVYVSQTPDPLGSYFNYAFTTPSFPDYPKYAVWPDAYYVTSNELNPAQYALERSAMLAGSPAMAQRFTAPNLSGFGFQALTPGELDGPEPPPAGAPGYFVRHRDTEAHGPGGFPSEDFLEIWEMSVDFVTPGNSTFTQTANIAITDFDSGLCGFFSLSCFPQAGGPALEPMREVVMWRFQYRNFGSHESLVGNFVTDVDGTDHGGIRWFELRKAGADPWSLHQEGTYAPDEQHRWVGSIAMDGAGNIALGYSLSSSSIFPGIHYTGRLVSDPPGTLPEAETALVDGTGPNPSNRWGNYSSMNIDPADDCSFWYTNAFGSSNWSTHVGVFRFDSCGTPDFTLSAVPDVFDVCAGSPAVYSIIVGSVGGYTLPVTLSASGNPSDTTSGFSSNPVTPPGTSDLTIGNTAAANPGSYSIDVEGDSVSGTHAVTVGLGVFDATPAAPSLVNPPDGAPNQSLTPNFDWTAGAQSAAFTIEVATDIGFTDIVASATVESTEHTFSSPLASNQQYFWRVRGENPCGSGPFSPVFDFFTEALPGDCGVGTTASVHFEDDFESGAPGWTHSGTGDTWALGPGITGPHSGSLVFHADDVSSVSDQRLVSPPVSLPASGSPITLQFWNYQELEDGGTACYDGGILEVSTDGSTWIQLDDPVLITDPYDGPIDDGYSNPLANLPAWCGDPQPWLKSVVDLDAYVDQTVQFRFRLGTDSSTSHPGWDIDDVLVQSCEVLPDLIFEDGFESGDTTAWSATVP